MKAFTTWHRIDQQFQNQQQQLISRIMEVIQPDYIFLLGSTIKKRKTESIFSTESMSTCEAPAYYFLILVETAQEKPPYEWQDRIEFHCKGIAMITTIVMETGRFKNNLGKAQLFACKVLQAATCIYCAGNNTLELPDNFNAAEINKEVKLCYDDGLKKAQEFLIGADLYRIRNQNALAAFMTHQAAEQGLRTLLKIGTGFNYQTHNLDRLIRYTCMVSYEVTDIFSRNNDGEKKIFNLLNTAYSEARYGKDYKVPTIDLLSMIEKVNGLVNVLRDSGYKYHLVNHY